MNPTIAIRFVRRYTGYIKSILRDWADDPEEIKDLCQETLVRFFECWEDLLKVGDTKPRIMRWLKTTALRLAWDLKRKESRLSFVDDCTHFEVLEGRDEGPDLQIDNKRFREDWLSWAEKQRKNRYLVDFIRDEICFDNRVVSQKAHYSRLWGCGENTAESRLVKIRSQIKERCLRLQKKG